MWNACSLNGNRKQELLRSFFKINSTKDNIVFALITETWLTENIKSGELTKYCENIRVLRADRKDGYGGVAIYHPTCVPVGECEMMETESKAQVLIAQFPTVRTIAICECYPP